MYKIIGADQKEYGPVTAEQIQRWIAENRANGQTRIQSEGGAEWKPLSSFPEFAAALSAKVAPVATPQAGPAGDPWAAADGILATGRELFRIGSCVTRGWELLKANFGAIFGGTLVFLLILGILSVLGKVPIVGILVSVGSLVISGPLKGGLNRLYLKCIRNQGVDIGEVFSGFQSGFLQMMLTEIVGALLVAVAAAPGGIVCGVAVAAIGLANPAGIFLLALGILLALAPAIYLSILWLFALPLVADKGMDFWQAMQLSRRVVGKHWGSAFCLVLVIGLINIAGLLMCGIGVLVSLPVGFGALMHAYEDIFGGSGGQAA